MKATHAIETLSSPTAREYGAACDGELLTGLAGGSRGALSELVGRYQAAVRRLCRKMLGTSADDDCSQEVFVRVWQKAHLFDPDRGAPSAWIMAVARNVALNIRAKPIPDPVDHLDLENDLLWSSAAMDPAGVDHLWLAAALASLSPAERQVIELAYFDDLSQTEIASELGVPLGTVKSWTRRGLNRLATMLDDGAQG